MISGALDEYWDKLVVLAEQQPNDVVDVAHQRVMNLVPAVAVAWDDIKSVQLLVQLGYERMLGIVHKCPVDSVASSVKNHAAF